MIADGDPIDPKLEALLREHSTDAPSSDIDAAILAAAHRAVQSAPQSAVNRAAEATRPWRWWMPLAAAATIGAIAIGVLQVTPKESDSTATVVSDTPPAIRSKPEQVQPSAPAASVGKDNGEAPRVASEAPRAPSEAPRAPSEAPRAKVRVDRPPPSPAPAQKMEAERGASAEPFPSRERDAVEQANAAGAMARSEAPRATAPALAKQSVAAADAQATSPEQWIARIRALLADGKTQYAEQELIAFRAAYPDADARLPAELRAWAAAVKR